jgi:hypothetical protein
LLGLALTEIQKTQYRRGNGSLMTIQTSGPSWPMTATVFAEAMLRESLLIE